MQRTLLVPSHGKKKTSQTNTGTTFSLMDTQRVCSAARSVRKRGKGGLLTTDSTGHVCLFQKEELSRRVAMNNARQAYTKAHTNALQPVISLFLVSLAPTRRLILARLTHYCRVTYVSCLMMDLLR